MPLGSAVRKLFGRHEHRVAELYREMFMSVTDYGEQVTKLVESPRRILEIGGGEGAVTEVLAARFPDAEILSIDISPRIGRLYRGRHEGVTFRETTIQEVAVEKPGAFDLVTLSDVLHHVPHDLRQEVLAAAASCVAPGGRFLLKDWGRAPTPIHWLCHAGDRFLTGDRVAYLTPDEANAIIKQSAPKLTPAGRATIRPWRNNYVQLFAC